MALFGRLWFLKRHVTLAVSNANINGKKIITLEKELVEAKAVEQMEEQYVPAVHFESMRVQKEFP
eukprot:gene20620-7568_t